MRGVALAADAPRARAVEEGDAIGEVGAGQVPEIHDGIEIALQQEHGVVLPRRHDEVVSERDRLMQQRDRGGFGFGALADDRVPPGTSAAPLRYPRGISARPHSSS